jgi:hypothetical protein
VKEPRLAQLSRIFQTDIATHEAGRAAISARPGDFASALFLEAADSDDVIGIESARTYLEDRLAYFGELVEAVAGVAVRAAFELRLKAWA